MSQKGKIPHIVIIGGGFGGLQAAKALARKPVKVTLIDKKNHHTFQPLLYQVATAVLSPGEIASPIRRILYKYQNIEVLLGEVAAFDKERRQVILRSGAEVPYDHLIVAAGARHSYFGHDEWEADAPGLKTLEDAVEIRRRVLLAFEKAERQAILTGRHDPLNFAIVGGGPTGVELAGAIAGIARQALAQDFKAIDTTTARVMLLEGSTRILGAFAEDLSLKAEEQLTELGVAVYKQRMVTEVSPGQLKVGAEIIPCSVILWATGVAASPLGKALGAAVDRAGRVLVEPDLTIPGHKNIFVIGDMASLKDEKGNPIPGVAPAAMQEADLTAANILRDLAGEPYRNFKYFDKGSMATVGRNRAIVQVGNWHFAGYFAWLMWLFVHIMSLVGFRNRLWVLSEWFWAYFTRERSARLITGDAEQMRLQTQAGNPSAETAKPAQVA